jgi:WD40 repeat protein
MKDNFENELKSNGLSYAEKLEERMLARDEAKEASEEKKDEKPMEPGIVDGQVAPIVKASAEAAAPSGNEPMIKPKYHIRGHFDSVRGVHYSQSLKVLASASVDCQVKLWNVKSIQKDYESSNGFLE